MKDRRTLMRIVLLVAAAALLVLAAKSVGVKRATSIATTQEIENLLAGLDPATRASVVARLTADAARHIKELRTGLAN